jgi:hypothetical protein
MEMLFNILMLLVFGGVVWCVASEGAWGAGIIFLSVIFSGLLAMNFFESLAAALEGTIPPEYADIVALCGIFIAFVFAIRFLTEKIAPVDIELPGPVYQAGRWGFAVLTGYITMAFLLTALHTAPLPREFAGFKPERKNFLNMSAPDRQWLGFTQYVSEKVLCNTVAGKPRVFDGLYLKLPGRSDDTFWASFPIRYAHRRAAFSQGSAAATSSGLQGSRGTTPPKGGSGF